MIFNNISDRIELADHLGISHSTIPYYLFHSTETDNYTTFFIPKKNGGEREICAPKQQLKWIQRRLATAILEYQSRVDLNEGIRRKVAHGFINGRSFITNAKSHRNKRYVINLDIEDYFPTFHFGRIYGFFINNKNYMMESKVAAAIAGLVCFEGKLPQGAPTSPVISNLIFDIVDCRLIRIAKKYRLTYTRYADDLSFSTNKKDFTNYYDSFIFDVRRVIEESGFKLNDYKTRIQYRDSRQMVTGLVVNEDVSVPREYYKTTRAMAHTLYKNGIFTIDGDEGKLDQLEGRFSYIMSVEEWKKASEQSIQLTGKGKEYAKFLFFKYFYGIDRPVVLTEGKTDALYLKAALKNLHNDFPSMIQKRTEGDFEYKIKFFKRNAKTRKYLDVNEHGGDAFAHFASQLISSGRNRDFYETLYKLSKKRPREPVILLFDNETKKDGNVEKPLGKFLGTMKKNKVNTNVANEVKSNLFAHITHNVYVATIKLPDGSEEAEIEDLFPQDVLGKVIDGKTFCRDEIHFDKEKNYSKEVLARYVASNWKSIDFSGFRSLFETLNSIIVDYNNVIDNTDHM